MILVFFAAGKVLSKINRVNVVRLAPRFCGVGASNSNRNCRFVARPSQASFHYLATATHTLGNEVEVICYSDGASSVNSYEVEVKGPEDSYFSLAAIVPPTGTNWVNYLDADINPASGAYQYNTISTKKVVASESLRELLTRD